MVDCLIASKANIDSLDKDKDSLTPLHYAAEYGHTKVIQLLLKESALVNSQSQNGSTSLHCIAQKNTVYVYVHLLSSLLSSFGLNAVAPITYQYLTDGIMSCGNQREALEMLLEARADVNIKDNNHLTPLQLALKCGRDEIVEVFNKHTPDDNVKALH